MKHLNSYLIPLFLLAIIGGVLVGVFLGGSDKIAGGVTCTVSYSQAGTSASDIRYVSIDARCEGVPGKDVQAWIEARFMQAGTKQ